MPKSEEHIKAVKRGTAAAQRAIYAHFMAMMHADPYNHDQQIVRDTRILAEKSLSAAQKGNDVEARMWAKKAREMADNIDNVRGRI